MPCFPPYGFTHFSDLNALLVAQSGKQLFSVTHRLLKDRGVLLLSPVAQAEDKEIFHWTPNRRFKFSDKAKIRGACHRKCSLCDFSD